MNKPVAWQVAEMLFDIEESAIEMAKVYGDKIIPLYTHPVELTDEEILFMCDEHRNKYGGIEPLGFAKAILRKAQDR